MPLLLISREPLESGGELVEITFNRPDTMNAMSVDDMPEVVRCLDGLAADPSVRGTTH